MAQPKSLNNNALVFNREKYVPIYFNNLSTRYSRSASKVYLDLFGVGIIEWRIVSLLSFEPNITANQIASSITTNKAAVSRSVGVLEKGGYIALTPAKDDSRKKYIRLTPKGEELNAQIFPVALERERLLLTGFTEKEVVALIGFLRRLNSALPTVEGYDRSLGSVATRKTPKPAG